MFLGMEAPPHGYREAPNLLIDIRDIGSFEVISLTMIDVGQIRLMLGDHLTENKIYNTMEEVSREKQDRVYVPNEDAEAQVQQLAQTFANDKTNVKLRIGVMSSQYTYSKYVRKNNTPEYAKYFRELDARELYPELKPKSFKQFVGGLIDGKVAVLQRPYARKCPFRNWVGLNALSELKNIEISHSLKP